MCSFFACVILCSYRQAPGQVPTHSGAILFMSNKINICFIWCSKKILNLKLCLTHKYQVAMTLLDFFAHIIYVGLYSFEVNYMGLVILDMS